MFDIYFWRQYFVMAGSVASSLCIGFVRAYPSVLNPAITSRNSTDSSIQTSQNHATWIAAINGAGGLLGAVALSPIMDIYGRKIVQYLMGSFLFIGWLIVPFAKDIGALYAMSFIQGISVGNINIACVILAEYAHPCRRGYFITLKKIAIGTGTMLCHAMSAFWTWRQIGIFAASPALLYVIMVFFWPESPYHLASNGKFEECEQSFRWLMGDSEEIEKESSAVINAQKKRDDIKRYNKYSLKSLLETLKSKKFRKEMIITSLVSLALELSGKFYFISYGIQIMMVLLSNKTSALYFTFGSDCFVLIALIISTIITKHFNRRTVLFSSGILSVFLMLFISAMVYASTIYKFSKYVMWFIALILMFQYFIVNLGLIPIAFALFSEIISLEHKVLGICICSLVFTILNTIFLKVTPVMIDGIGLHSTYGIYGLLLATCLVCLYKTVPETKDKTLQQIADELHGEINGQIMERETLMH